MKKLMALSLLAVILVVICALVFGQGKNSYHGIYITFENNTPTEHIEDVIKIPVKKVNEKVQNIEHLHIDSNSEHKSRDDINKQKYVDKEDKGG